MTLKQAVIFKCNDKLKLKLEEIAVELGVTKSALARNTIALIISPPYIKTSLEKIVDKIRQEARDELFVREDGYD